MLFGSLLIRNTKTTNRDIKPHSNQAAVKQQMARQAVRILLWWGMESSAKCEHRRYYFIKFYFSSSHNYPSSFPPKTSER